jgi:hypothetical protein
MNQEHNKPGNTLWQGKPWQDDITGGLDPPDESVRSAIFNAARAKARDNRLRTRVIPVVRRLHTGIGGYLAWGIAASVLMIFCYWYGRKQPGHETQQSALVQLQDKSTPVVKTRSADVASLQEYRTTKGIDDRIYELKTSLIKEKIAMYTDRAYGIYACNGNNRE